MPNFRPMKIFIKMHTKIKPEKLTYNQLPIILSGSLITKFNVDANNSTNDLIILDKITDENVITEKQIINPIGYIYLLKINDGVMIKKCVDNQYDLIRHYCKNDIILCSFGINIDQINELESILINEFNATYFVDKCVYEGNTKEMIKKCYECIDKVSAEL